MLNEKRSPTRIYWRSVEPHWESSWRSNLPLTLKLTLMLKSLARTKYHNRRPKQAFGYGFGGWGRLRLPDNWRKSQAKAFAGNMVLLMQCTHQCYAFATKSTQLVLARRQTWINWQSLKLTARKSPREAFEEATAILVNQYTALAGNTMVTGSPARCS